MMKQANLWSCRDLWTVPSLRTTNSDVFLTGKGSACTLPVPGIFLTTSTGSASKTGVWQSSAREGTADMMVRPVPPVKNLKAVLFDVDGTLADSDPLHYVSFRDLLQEIGFQGGISITREFFNKNISGKHNPDIGRELFPEWDQAKQAKFLDEKEAYFRRIAAETLKPVEGLHRFSKWIEGRDLQRAAVTNAPRINAEQMIQTVGLTNFFQTVVVGSECERGKPFPDPYLKALAHFGVSPDHAFALEDSPAGIKAAVAAGLAVVGLTTGNAGPDLLDAGASFLIRDFDDPALWGVLQDE